MNSTILRGSDGRRWLLIEGSGICTELKAQDTPKQSAPEKLPKRRVKRSGCLEF